MPTIGDDLPDIVKKRGRLESAPTQLAQFVYRNKLVEEREGELRDVARVSLVETEALAEG